MSWHPGTYISSSMSKLNGPIILFLHALSASFHYFSASLSTSITSIVLKLFTFVGSLALLHLSKAYIALSVTDIIEVYVPVNFAVPRMLIPVL